MKHYMNKDLDYCKEIIDPNSGKLTLKVDDIAMDGAIMPVCISRFYESVTRDTVGFIKSNSFLCGRGWRLSAHQKIIYTVDNEENQIIYLDEYGCKHYFVSTEQGIRDIDGLNMVFEGEPGFECSISNPDGTKMTFDAQGYLISVRDCNGNSLSYKYKNGMLVEAIDSLGRALKLEYNENNMLSAITDPQMRKVTYVYNDKKELVTVIYPDMRESYYEYDASHRICKVTSPDGIISKYTYDENDGLFCLTRSTFIEKISHNSIQLSEEAFTSESVIFDHNEMPIITPNEGANIHIDYNVNSKINVFGWNKNITKRVTETIKSLTIVKDYSNDVLIRTTVTDKHGNEFVSVFQYDYKSNLIACQDFRGIVTLYEYSPSGQITKEIKYHKDEFNQSESLYWPDKRIVKEYIYDKTGDYIRAAKSIDGKSYTHYDHDENSGLINYYTNSQGTRINFAYDQSSKRLVLVSACVGANISFVSYGYTNGLPTSVVNCGTEYKFDYDGFGKKITMAIGGEIVARKEYWKNGNIFDRTVYSTGEIVVIERDTDENIVSESYSPGNGKVAELQYRVRREDNGRTVEIQDNVIHTMYVYRYNELGLLLSEERNGCLFKKTFRFTINCALLLILSNY